MNQTVESLISEKSAVQIVNAGGSGKVLLVCEHAGQSIPAFISSLGVGLDIMTSHIAWDIGAAELATGLSRSLDSPLILQRYTRLAYDCNRAFDADDAIVSESDNITIPANIGLSRQDRQNRYDEVYLPFEKAIKQLLDQRLNRGLDTVVVSIHSFTPLYKGKRRQLELGVLHDSDTGLADALLRQTENETGFLSARNQPYSPEDGVTHTLITHGINRGLANTMLEVRNDLIDNEQGQQLWVKRLTGLLKNALEQGYKT